MPLAEIERKRAKVGKTSKIFKTADFFFMWIVFLRLDCETICIDFFFLPNDSSSRISHERVFELRQELGRRNKSMQIKLNEMAWVGERAFF